MKNEITEREIIELNQVLRWVAIRAVESFERKHPKAAHWYGIWAELRRAYCPTSEPSQRHSTLLVVIEYNRKTKKVETRILFVGTGNSENETVRDLLSQVKQAMPEAFTTPMPVDRPVLYRGHKVQIPGSYFPMGVFGNHCPGLS